MWSQTFGAGDDGTSRPVWQPPDNELPVGVPVAALLARTDDVAVALVGAQVYSSGVSLDVVVSARSVTEEISELVFGGRRGRGLLMGVEFADGRRGSLHGDGGDVLLTSRGGGGGGRSVQQGFWLHPVPPPGPLAVVALAPGLGVEETRTELDGGLFAAAVDGVVELWPWEPEEAGPGLVEPDPDLPEGSWFRG